MLDRDATLVCSLIVGLQERGLDVTRPVLAVLDGSKALRRAVLDVFDHPVIRSLPAPQDQNVRDQLPGKLRTVVERRIKAAYHADSALAAQASLEALAAELDKARPAPQPACAKASPRLWPCSGLGCRPPSPGRLSEQHPVRVLGALDLLRSQSLRASP